MMTGAPELHALHFLLADFRVPTDAWAADLIQQNRLSWFVMDAVNWSAIADESKGTLG